MGVGYLGVGYLGVEYYGIGVTFIERFVHCLRFHEPMSLCDRIRIRLCVCSGALPSNYLCDLYAHPGIPMYIQAPLLSIKQHAISL